ncbi:hypothetical protein DPEC_G00098870 [Dallia pectoralis]|uniref:Uncharacterized protein n=1 Tax=Dallia pectoralis TaxID=75939 RepID=A0ACC2GVS7_DALPE|nr:hypothetical protein DPEC_G00098870 [Dallia pectoralis]
MIQRACDRYLFYKAEKRYKEELHHPTRWKNPPPFPLTHHLAAYLTALPNHTPPGAPWNCGPGEEPGLRLLLLQIRQSQKTQWILFFTHKPSGINAPSPAYRTSCWNPVMDRAEQKNRSHDQTESPLCYSTQPRPPVLAGPFVRDRPGQGEDLGCRTACPPGGSDGRCTRKKQREERPKS